jgi:hypothetical protein
MSAIIQTYIVWYGYMDERMERWMDEYSGMIKKKLND